MEWRERHFVWKAEKSGEDDVADMINTEAWMLYKAAKRGDGPGELVRESHNLKALESHEILVEPLLGCWEGNMTHALDRDPVDICVLRRERKIVLGNAGVMRVVRVGKDVKKVAEGDVCMLAPIAKSDNTGYLITVFGYDARFSVGLLSKQTKLTEQQLLRIPKDSQHTLNQWAAFSLRYQTAWSNWAVSYQSLRAMISPEDIPSPWVFGWGGGVSLAQLALAKFHGCKAAMIASRDSRLQLIRSMGIVAIDRREFPDLWYDEERFEKDKDYKAAYLASESIFLEKVAEITKGQGVSIFIDNIGTPVFRATQKAMSRQGVITTCGWKEGTNISLNRAKECIHRNIYVHTHGSRHKDGEIAISFAEETGWLPPHDDDVYGFDDIPQLADDYRSSRTDSYFPLFRVND